MALIDYIVIDDLVTKNTKCPPAVSVKQVYAELVELLGLMPEPIEINVDHRFIDPDIQSAGSN